MTTAPAAMTAADVSRFISISPVVILGAMKDETVEILARCAPHITVVQAERGEFSLIADKPAESSILLPSQVVAYLLDAALVLPTSRGEILSLVDGLARDIEAGSWPTTARRVRALYDALLNRTVDHKDVPARLRQIAAPLVRFAQ